MVCVALVAVSGGFPRSSFAQDTALRTVISERGVFDDNVNLRPDSDGWTFGSVTSVDSHLVSNTAESSADANVHADYNHFFGPGATSDLNSIDWLVDAGADRRFLRTELGVRASYQKQAVRESELLDTGATEGEADRQSVRVAGHASYDASDVDMLTLRTEFQDVSFDGTSGSQRLNPFYAVSANLGWARQLNETETLTLDLDALYYDADDSSSTVDQKVSLGALYEALLTQRFRVWGGGGLGVVFKSRDRVNRDRHTDSSPYLDLEAGIGYSFERTIIDLSYSSGLDPSAGGELKQRDSVQFHLGYEATSTVTIDVSALYSAQHENVDLVPIGTTSRTYNSIETKLTWQFLERWNLSTGYRFRHDDEDDGTATSHSIFAQLNYAFTLLP